MKNPSVLAFERKLDPSDAVFFAGNWDDKDNDTAWSGISVREKSVRGTISNRLKAKDMDPAKLNASIEKPNLQTVDVAALPEDRDTLRARFTLRILGGVGRPSACNDSEYQAKLADVITGYKEAFGFKELARRYAVNLANARFLWRNRLAAEQVCVCIRHLVEGKSQTEWSFDSTALSLKDFDLEESVQQKIAALAAVIEEGLASETGYRILEVTAFARMGQGQEVFPSQELILDRGKGKSKTLYVVNGIAGMHSQKIGNALRTIDTWYPDNTGPIAVEPYGSVTSLGMAYRQPSKKCDFYSLIDAWMLKDKAPEEGNQHYVMAILIRGGVFGESGKE